MMSGILRKNSCPFGTVSKGRLAVVVVVVVVMVVALSGGRVRYPAYPGSSSFKRLYLQCRVKKVGALRDPTRC